MFLRLMTMWIYLQLRHIFTLLPAVLQTLPIGFSGLLHPLVSVVYLPLSVSPVFQEIQLGALSHSRFVISYELSCEFKTSTCNLLSVNYGDIWFSNQSESFNDLTSS